jgi:predicted RNA methylase
MDGGIPMTDKKTITITHDYKNGTLVHGTEKGDGAYELIGPRTIAHFRFFPSIKMIGISQSRDRPAKRHQITAAREALEAGGFEVIVEINDEPRDMADVRADRAGRLDTRYERLTEAAERNLTEAERRRARADELADERQPIRSGHSSASHARVIEKRLAQNDKAADTALAKAQHASRAASVVGDADAYRERPSVIRRRIDRLEAELRQTMHGIDGTRPANQSWKNAYYPVKPATGDDLAALEASKTYLEHQIEADRAALAEHQASGYVLLTRNDLHKGDVVTWSTRFGQNATVVRVNPKTVTLDRTSYPRTLPYEQILTVECPHEATTTTVRAPKSPTTRAKAAPITASAAVDRGAPLVVDGSAEFFPTPPGIAAQMIAAAHLEPDMMVLEPSAGLGGIAIPVAEEGCLVTCFERSASLTDRLRTRCAADSSIHVNCGDFLGVQPGPLLAFDRVLMNPPFHGQADIAHVMHALGFLKPGGLLVAIMSAGAEFHSNKTATAFRQLVADRGGRMEKLPEDAFKSSGISVRTVMVIIPAGITPAIEPAAEDQPGDTGHMVSPPVEVVPDAVPAEPTEEVAQLSLFA